MEHGHVCHIREVSDRTAVNRLFFNVSQGCFGDIALKQATITRTKPITIHYCDDLAHIGIVPALKIVLSRLPS
jgi:hypothetical protein